MNTRASTPICGNAGPGETCLVMQPFVSRVGSDLESVVFSRSGPSGVQAGAATRVWGPDHEKSSDSRSDPITQQRLQRRQLLPDRRGQPRAAPRVEMLDADHVLEQARLVEIHRTVCRARRVGAGAAVEA